ncbi:LysR family transcriptional regulator [Alkaliphilus sp. B6464]|uniref:LysR family transcriptional regulator n=1 Tax=Alkaliphilus sp. B6464 TaxID=2731219 RepID=UPI001BA6865C|nr:LysR family transcriptional regulator [Alkaliphilus sp. B6464]QUH20918.1 LysR family transcriptional regulator [Alkaliphilus sp. B6464]
MDTKKFETLLKVIDYRSITKAGEDLGYTQSGVSHMIKAIEKELGFPVLVRNKSGVVPTEDCKKIIPALRQLVNWNEQFEQITASIKGITIGKVRIGTFTSMSVHWLPRIIKEFQTDYPNIEIELEEGGNRTLSYGIENGLIDVGFCSKPTDIDVDWIPLFDDCLMAVLPPTFEVSGMNTFPLQMFNKTPFIALSEDFDCEVQKIFQQNSICPDVKFSSTDDYTIISMVEQELGFSILPEMVLRGYKHCSVQTLVLEPYCKRQLGIALSSIKNASPATKKFIQYAKKIIDYKDR